MILTAPDPVQAMELDAVMVVADRDIISIAAVEDACKTKPLLPVLPIVPRAALSAVRVRAIGATTGTPTTT